MHCRTKIWRNHRGVHYPWLLENGIPASRVVQPTELGYNQLGNTSELGYKQLGSELSYKQLGAVPNWMFNCAATVGLELHILIWHVCIHFVAMEVWHCSSSGDKSEFLDEICARHMIYARACQDSWHGVMLERKSNPRPLWCCWHMSHLIRHIQWNLCHIYSVAQLHE